jgi:hypothetical protein
MQCFFQAIDLKHYFGGRWPIEGQGADFLWSKHEKFAHIWGKHLLMCLPSFNQSRA